MEPSTTPEIIIGLDVGKTGHHACALTNTGERIYDKPLPQDEAAQREIFASMQAHGSVLMVVDQPNTIGALPIAVARDCGCTVGDLPDLAMRKAADLYPGRSKPPPECIHHRRHRPHHAAHTAGSPPRRRDTSSAEDARRIPRRHRQRRHPNENRLRSVLTQEDGDVDEILEDFPEPG